MYTHWLPERRAKKNTHFQEKESKNSFYFLRSTLAFSIHKWQASHASNMQWTHLTLTRFARHLVRVPVASHLLTCSCTAASSLQIWFETLSTLFLFSTQRWPCATCGLSATRWVLVFRSLGTIYSSIALECIRSYETFVNSTYTWK